MASKHLSDRPEFDPPQNIEGAVESVVAKYSLRNLRTIVLITFLAGTWAAALQFQLFKLSAALSDFHDWKKQVDIFQNGRRFTADDYDAATDIFNRQKPPVNLPTFREVTRGK